MALKSSDMVDLSSRKIVIYINNRDKFDRTAKITYSYDTAYYELREVRKISELSGCKQSKEEVHVKLKDKQDFDSLIEAKLTVYNSSLSSKEITFLLPTMFVEFTRRKP